MSERKVLNKYYPPDFDPSKIPRVKGSKNRQFTVRLMAPCNMKCYTCGEYIAKGKKFNARKEDVENQSYLGIRIYRFYIKCPGCISEISFRTDPETTDYIIEAGAHRNFQALKLAEDQAAREAQDVQDEIDSNPMLLLENRTQQSQYEMDLLESLEDLREMNDRHAGIDLGKIASKYQEEKKLTAEQKEEAERMEALVALGYELIEGKLIKRLREEDIDDEAEIKKIKGSDWKTCDPLTSGKQADFKPQNSLKAKLSGLIKKKSAPKTNHSLPSASNLFESGNTSSKLSSLQNRLASSGEYANRKEINNETKTEMLPPWPRPSTSQPGASSSLEKESSSIQISGQNNAKLGDSITAAISTQEHQDSNSNIELSQNIVKTATSSLSLLGAYSNSDSDEE